MRGTSPQTPRTTETTKRLGLALERLSGLHRGSTRRGFTIVELLIVVVVIAILAAITVVAYTGITNKANDSARLADASTIEKAIQLRKIEHGSGTDRYGYPETREEMLAILGLKGIASRTVVVYIDEIDTSNFDRSKVYMRVDLYCRGDMVGNDCSIPLELTRADYSYWSTAEGVWRNVGHNFDLADGDWEIDKRDTSSEEGPFRLAIPDPL